MGTSALTRKLWTKTLQLRPQRSRRRVISSGLVADNSPCGALLVAVRHLRGCPLAPVENVRNLLRDRRAQLVSTGLQRTAARALHALPRLQATVYSSDEAQATWPRRPGWRQRARILDKAPHTSIEVVSNCSLSSVRQAKGCAWLASAALCEPRQGRFTGGTGRHGLPGGRQVCPDGQQTGPYTLFEVDAACGR
jgi:hypothetical protein